MDGLRLEETRLLLEEEGGQVIAGMATHAKRKSSVVRAARSIARQVDRLYIYINDYTDLPPCLNEVEKTTIILGQDADGDLGPAGKFRALQGKKGILVMVDDDLIYPKDYVARLRKGLAAFGGRVPVSFHGHHLNLDSGGRGRGTGLYHGFNRNCGKTRPVHVLGTGCMGIDTRKLKLPQIRAGRVDHPFAVWCEKRGIPRYVLAHRSGWIGRISGTRETSLWRKFQESPALQKKELALVGGIKWSRPPLSVKSLKEERADIPIERARTILEAEWAMEPTAW